MAIYLTGKGGSDSNDGTSWANRKLTIEAGDALCTAPGDKLYVGPGTYRELVTPAADGTSGNPISIIGDESGKFTDGIGGQIRITGSDNDTSGARNQCIYSSTTRSFRTFQGLYIDGVAANSASAGIACVGSGTDWIIEDCYFGLSYVTSANGVINFQGAQSNHIVRRCRFFGTRDRNIWIQHSSTVDNANILIENCEMISGTNGILIDRVGGVTVKNTRIHGMTSRGIRVQTALNSGQVCTVYNSFITECATGLQATTTAEFTEDYNNVGGNGTDRSNVTAGSNSVANRAFFDLGRLNGAKGRYIGVPPYVELHRDCTLRNKTGTSVASEDILGRSRALETIADWGPSESNCDITKETTIVRTGSNAFKLSGRGFIDFRLPITVNSQITVSAWSRHADNANIGTKPKLEVFDYDGTSLGSDTVTGDGSSFEELSVTCTPNAVGNVIFARYSNQTTHTSAIASYVDDVART